MAIELYWGSGSPFAWRVMLTLELKRLPYESKLLEFSKQEHKTPQILNARRRQRIAKGSGVTVTEVNTLLNKFGEMQQMMKKMGKFQKMMARMGGGPPPGMFRR